jgi:hypothetical protein
MNPDLTICRQLLVAIQSNTNTIKGDTTELRRALACKVKADMDEKVFSWLSAPNLTANYENVKKKRQPETGLWFTNDDEFKRRNKNRRNRWSMIDDHGGIIERNPRMMLMGLPLSRSNIST